MDRPVLAALTLDAGQAAAALERAKALARELRAPLLVVRIYPAAWRGAAEGGPRDWHLRSDEPRAALGAFAARRRALRVVL